MAQADAALVLLELARGWGCSSAASSTTTSGRISRSSPWSRLKTPRDVLEELDWGVIADPDPAAVELAVERLLDPPRPRGGRPIRTAGTIGSLSRDTWAAVFTEVSAGDPVHRERWP